MCASKMKVPREALLFIGIRCEHVLDMRLLIVALLAVPLLACDAQYVFTGRVVDGQGNLYETCWATYTGKRRSTGKRVPLGSRPRLIEQERFPDDNITSLTYAPGEYRLSISCNGAAGSFEVDFGPEMSRPSMELGTIVLEREAEFQIVKEEESRLWVGKRLMPGVKLDVVVEGRHDPLQIGIELSAAYSKPVEISFWVHAESVDLRPAMYRVDCANSPNSCQLKFSSQRSQDHDAWKQLEPLEMDAFELRRKEQRDGE